MTDEPFTDLQTAMKEVSDRMKAGETEEDILNSKKEESAQAHAEVPAPEETTEEPEEEIEAAEEVVDDNTEVDESEDESTEEEEGTALDAPAFWNKSQKDAWEDIPDDHRSSAMEIFKGLEKTVSEKATELDITKKRIAVFDNVARPYEAMLASEGASPESALETYLSTAYQLRNCTPRQKHAIVQNMATHFGIDIHAMEDDLPPDPQQPAMSEQHVANLVEQRLQTHTNRAGAAAQVETFVNQRDTDGNLAHPHFDKLRTTMAAFINTGDDLEAAYTKAVRSDPELYEEAIKADVLKQTKAKTNGELKKVSKAKKAAGVKVNGGQKAKDVPSAKNETIVQTMQRVRDELSSEQTRL